MSSNLICKLIPTPFVVDKNPCKGTFLTIQSAIDAARAIGGGTIYIHEGAYVENITLYDGIALQAVDILGVRKRTTVLGQAAMFETGTASIMGLTFVAVDTSPLILVNGSNGSPRLNIENIQFLSGQFDAINVLNNGILNMITSEISADNNAIVVDSGGQLFMFLTNVLTSNGFAVVAGTDANVELLYNNLQATLSNAISVGNNAQVFSFSNTIFALLFGVLFVDNGTLITEYDSWFSDDASDFFASGNTGTLEYAHIVLEENFKVAPRIRLIRLNVIPKQ